MPYPETEHIVPYLKYAHGLFNSLIIMLFLYQAWLGLQIRRRRTAVDPPEMKFVRRHRKFGPLIAILGISGFAGGLGIAFLREGEIVEHPLHFLTGATICSLIIATFLISKKIRGRDASWRNPHYIIGIIIVCLYFFQAFLGINMLLAYAGLLSFAMGRLCFF